ncbi:unnamed protein product [Acanthoscelides obtectus]|uniref:Zinc transporter 2 n=1 Tax=Acanthoscelides obtectus TaxID=200917 RepID=A0A9P0KBY2_ACAOB|nr:unnamed protein product [Acanthoscelides obtectus]CAK1672621.1 Zinc transporter 8 [Acanthoscelides obtectus]
MNLLSIFKYKRRNVSDISLCVFYFFHVLFGLARIYFCPRFNTFAFEIFIKKVSKFYRAAYNASPNSQSIMDCYREPVHTDFHCHDSLSSSHDGSAWKKLLTAAGFCLLFMIAELLGGYIAGSLAVMTDAAHLFSDFIGFLISLLAIWIGRKPPSKNMTFGYYRAEVVGALLSVLTVWLLAAIFSTLAINRIYNEDYDIDANTMIIIASLGLIVNIIMGGILHGVCHSHGIGGGHHSHVHHEPRSGADGTSNINVRAAAIHVLGDLLQSIGVLIAAVIIKFYPNANIADPICTLIFSVIVICTTIRVGKESLWYLIEGSPIDASQLRQELSKLASVKHVHSLHIWSLAAGKNAIAVHLAVDPYCDRDVLLKKTIAVIQSHISVVSCTVQIETFNLELSNSCKHCQIANC